jgi:hypothetical protein
MRSEPPKKNKWLNRKPLDRPHKMWYNKNVKREAQPRYLARRPPQEEKVMRVAEKK